MKSLDLNPRIGNVYVIGAGGIGGQLLTTLVLTLAKVAPLPMIHIYDGDNVEEKNLDRQFFGKMDIGKNKAEVWCERLKEIYPFDRIRGHPTWFTNGETVEQLSLFMVCVDNHPARLAALQVADREGGYVIIGANETIDAEAYYYHHLWHRGPRDPRQYYPDILTSHEGDPLSAAIGCTGAAQIANPQLAIANHSAANYMLRLFWFWFVESQNLDESTFDVWPVRFSNNFSQQRTARLAEFKEQEPVNPS